MQRRTLASMTGPPDGRRVAGVDGCRAGWLAVVRGDGATTIELLDDAGLADLVDAVETVWIDMPIGLVDATSARPCDVAVRRALGRAGASRVFNPPTRAALEATDYTDACTRNADACGAKLSKQTWHLVSKIRALDIIVRQGDRRDRVREAHPEWQFAALAGHTLPRKKTPDGIAARRVLLEAVWPGCLTAADACIASTRRSDVARDDVYDALVLAWGASGPPGGVVGASGARQVDATGLRCEIWRRAPAPHTVRLAELALRAARVGG